MLPPSSLSSSLVQGTFPLSLAFLLVSEVHRWGGGSGPGRPSVGLVPVLLSEVPSQPLRTSPAPAGTLKF